MTFHKLKCSICNGSGKFANGLCPGDICPMCEGTGLTISTSLGIEVSEREFKEALRIARETQTPFLYDPENVHGVSLSP